MSKVNVLPEFCGQLSPRELDRFCLLIAGALVFAIAFPPVIDEILKNRSPCNIRQRLLNAGTENLHHYNPLQIFLTM